MFQEVLHKGVVAIQMTKILETYPDLEVIIKYGYQKHKYLNRTDKVFVSAMINGESICQDCIPAVSFACLQSHNLQGLGGKWQHNIQYISGGMDKQTYIYTDTYQKGNYISKTNLD